jgi:hypothetical protein
VDFRLNSFVSLADVRTDSALRGDGTSPAIGFRVYNRQLGTFEAKGWETSGLPVTRPECAASPWGLFRIERDVIGLRRILGWATHDTEKLRTRETVSFRPRGASMKGRIESGQFCTVAPVDCSTLSVGDIVLGKSSRE